MPEDQKSGFSEAVETGASAAHTIRGAIKTGKAISSAAKGAAAGGPYGAVAGAVWAGRKHIGKIIVAVIALLMLPVLFVLMLPGLIFGGLTNAFSPSDPEIPILNSETAIIENANEITLPSTASWARHWMMYLPGSKLTLRHREPTIWRSKMLIPAGLFITPTWTAFSYR